MKNRCENRSFLMAQNHVSHYTLRLFYTFAIFEKNQKIDAKRDTKSLVFWPKNRPSAPKGRLIRPFFSIFEDSKNHRFFDASPVAQKIGKIGQSGGQEPIQVKRLGLEWWMSGIWGPRAAPFRVRKPTGKELKGNKKQETSQKEGSDTPIGRWPGEFPRELQ